MPYASPSEYIDQDHDSGFQDRNFKFSENILGITSRKTEEHVPIYLDLRSHNDKKTKIQDIWAKIQPLKRNHMKQWGKKPVGNWKMLITVNFKVEINPQSLGSEKENNKIINWIVLDRNKTLQRLFMRFHGLFGGKTFLTQVEILNSGKKCLCRAMSVPTCTHLQESRLTPRIYFLRD
jgi:hypothetical protein